MEASGCQRPLFKPRLRGNEQEVVGIDVVGLHTYPELASMPQPISKIHSASAASAIPA